ncbi:hypothetical protein ACFRAU_06770 [Arthrobacter sp. NPDC056691]|uniref:hypothetical protein n=1 Tax=Arthrobacter sp. NPDC056691 TaxID=3345913 RepID=UPI003671F550
MTSDGGAEREDGAEREAEAERKNVQAAAPGKSAKGRRAKAGGQERTGVVPKTAAEDDPRTWGDAESGNDHDAWLKEQRPPHWG